VPYGVCGQIIPWNFPLLMLAWKIAPALAAGNTVVLKPAEFTSLTALLFAEICQRVGLPKGVVNIVTGEGDTGAAIVNHPGIDKIAFTGSTEVGKIIRAATAGSGKGLSLELGGKSPYIVFEDADHRQRHRGPGRSHLVQPGPGVLRRIAPPGAGEHRGTLHRQAQDAHGRACASAIRSINPSISVRWSLPVQVERIRDLMKRGVAKEGAIRSMSPMATCRPSGCFLKPALVTNVSPANTLVAEEIFGPVLVAMSFRTPEEAVALANNTKYGLAATLWSENINLALDIAPKIKAGVVWINGTNNFDAAVGFGGYKESGFGREGGREGMAAYLKPLPGRRTSSRLPPPRPPSAKAANPLDAGQLDQTAKMYIGGKQARPDSGYSRAVLGAGGKPIGEVGEGNRKDIRNAVEAARAALRMGHHCGPLTGPDPLLPRRKPRLSPR
jgi:aldehyde dehydrogenase (NAD+)